MKIRLLSDTFIIILMFSLTMCSGCYNRVELEDTVAAVAHGLDLSPDGTRLISTAQFALPKQSGGEEDAPKYLLRSASGPTFSAAEQIINSTLPRKPVWSLAETFIVGDNIARHDISFFLDHLARTNTVRESSLLFLAWGSTPEQILRTETKPEDTAGAALPKMIRAQEPQTGLYSPVSINEFLYKVSTPGIEPVLPQVVIENFEGKERLALKGLAVFRGNQMVGSLNERESWGFHLMQNSTRGGLFEISLPDQEGSDNRAQQILELANSRAEIVPLPSQGSISMRITVSAEGNLYELDKPENLSGLEMLGRFEQQANEAMRSDVSACISRAQSYQSDVLGWGQILEQQQPALWENLKKDWPAQFANIPFEVEVDYKLRRTYLQGRSTVEQ